MGVIIMKLPTDLSKYNSRYKDCSLCKLWRFIRCQDCGILRNYFEEIKRNAKCCEKYAKYHFVQGLNISEMRSAAELQCSGRERRAGRDRERESEITPKLAA